MNENYNINHGKISLLKAPSVSNREPFIGDPTDPPRHLNRLLRRKVTDFHQKLLTLEQPVDFRQFPYTRQAGH